MGASKSEDLPIALLEYGLAKLSMVINNVGECCKFVENGQSVIVLEKENRNAFAKELETYMYDKRKSL